VALLERVTSLLVPCGIQERKESFKAHGSVTLAMRRRRVASWQCTRGSFKKEKESSNVLQVYTRSAFVGILENYFDERV